MIQDPSAELVGLVRRAGMGEPRSADRGAAQLVRRRFGLALPPPFVPPLEPGTDPPIRIASAVDGPAIAGLKWRSWQVGYRGVVDDDFLDNRAEIHPTAGWWAQRATYPPSRRHRLFVLGRTGSVHGFCDCGPYRNEDSGDDAAGETVGQVNALYIDPTAFRRGFGAALLAGAVDHLRAVGFSEFRLWVVSANANALGFYRSQGWETDGRSATRRFPDLTVDEGRMRFVGSSRPTPP